MSAHAAGAVLGFLGGLGLLMVLSSLRRLRSPHLEDRLAPYLRDAAPSRLLDLPRGSGPFGTVERLLAPFAADMVRRVRATRGGSDIRKRLEQLGSECSPEDFRAEQVVWGLLGAGLGVGVGAMTLMGDGVGVGPFTGLVILGASLGVLGRDQLLSIRIRRRTERMAAELPVVAELLALAVGAGEGAAGALERVARTCQGELSAELRRTLADARAGASLVSALEGLSSRTALPALSRFADGIAVAVERGTPLGDVLRAQAQDAREEARRRIMEIGGRRELAMMVPVVFLILPVTVVFAIYPGLAVLELG